VRQQKEEDVKIVQFEPNVPMEVTLDSPQGVVIQGRYGNRIMFLLTDGRVMYVPPIVAAKIEAERILPGEPFELCKSEAANEHGRPVEWVLKRIDASRKQRCPAKEPETELERRLHASVDWATAKKATPPGDPPRNGTTPPPVATKLEHALRTAISAAFNAEKYGAELGYVVRFDADAIKSMAITVLINMSEGGRR
jgi:hypothetical protein